MKKTIMPLLGILLAVLLCNSCIDDKYDVTKMKDQTLVFDQGLGLPLLHSSVMTVKETLMRQFGSDKLDEYDDHLVYFKYENIKFPIDASKYPVLGVSMPDLAVSNATPGWTVAAGKSTYIISVTIPFPGFTGDEQIDSIVLNAVLHNITVTSSFGIVGGTLTISIPGLKKNNVAYSLPVALPTGASPTAKATSLEGYTLQLQPGNQFVINYTLVVNSATPSGQISVTGHSFKQASASSNLDYKYIYGYLGKKQIFNQTMTLPINLFKDVEGMTFVDPKVEIEIVNSFGVPINVSFNNLVAKSSTGANVPINIAPLDAALNVNYPKAVTDPVLITNKVFNKDNTTGTIVTAMNSQPSQFTYNITATLNPQGTVVKNQFVKSDSKLDINFGIIFPLWGTCERYSIIDTIAFDYAELAEKATSLGFKVWLNNGIPANGTLNMIFLDENNVEVDRVIDATNNTSVINIVTSPEINDLKANGTKESTFWLEYKHLEKLKDIKKCAIQINFKSAPDGKSVVKVYSTNTLQMKIGLRVQMAFKK